MSVASAAHYAQTKASSLDKPSTCRVSVTDNLISGAIQCDEGNTVTNGVPGASLTPIIHMVVGMMSPRLQEPLVVRSHSVKET